MRYDLIIIGAGPGGYHTAIRGAQRGLSVALIERENVGGVCLNVGCIPTKALYASAKRLLMLREQEAFGISGEITFDFSQAQKRKDDVVSRMVAGVEKLLKKNKVTLIRGEAIFNKNGVIVDGEQIFGKNIVIATGSRPLMLPFFNIDHQIILDPTDLLNIKECPESLLILGGGVMGIEFATIFNAFGVAVTIVELEKQVLTGVDRSVVARQVKLLKKRGVKILTRTEVIDIQNQDGVAQFTLSNNTVLSASKALIAVGRSFNSDISGLKAFGVTVDSKGAIIVDQQQRTAVPNIFAIGDVVAGAMLAHVASYEGDRVIHTIFNEVIPKSTLPAAIFTIPEIATVGVTPGNSDDSLIKGQFLYGGNGKAITMGETDGVAVIYCYQKSPEIACGATIMGAGASGLIQIISIAINESIPIKSISEMIFAHPTLGEIILEAFEDIEGYSIHK